MAKRSNFSAQVSKFVLKSKLRLDAVYKSSVQDTLIDANTPTTDGGRMRVKTSFLRNSLVVGLNQQPTGPSDPRNDSQGNQGEQILTVDNASVSDIIWAGWSAKYARYREYKDGFLETAVRKWPETVRANTRKIKALIR